MCGSMRLHLCVFVCVCVYSCVCAREGGRERERERERERQEYAIGASKALPPHPTPSPPPPPAPKGFEANRDTCVELVKMLLKEGANVAAVDDQGCSALHRACSVPLPEALQVASRTTLFFLSLACSFALSLIGSLALFSLAHAHAPSLPPFLSFSHSLARILVSISSVPSNMSSYCFWRAGTRWFCGCAFVCA